MPTRFASAPMAAPTGRGATSMARAATPVPLVINEVDYDQPGTGDTQEFVELRNNSPFPANLSRFKLVLVNGNDNNPYESIALSGTLAPGQYLVVGSDGVGLAP